MSAELRCLHLVAMDFLSACEIITLLIALFFLGGLDRESGLDL